MNTTQIRAFVTALHIQAAITGHVKAGATIKQIQKVTGLSVFDIEAVIIEKKLSVKS